MTELQPIRQELLIDGAWVDVTSETRGVPREVRITRGNSSEQAALSTDVAAFQLDNTDGRFSNRNPLSPYYGMIGPWTPYRCFMQTTDASLRLTDTSTLGTDDYDGARAWTADKAVLDITGDIDVRVDAEADDWTGRAGHILASKYVSTGNQRSWSFTTDQYGRLLFIWTTDGTSATRTIARSTDYIPDRGRLYLRAVLDVNTGAGCAAYFYTGDSMTGPWTQLGATVTGPLTTSIYASSAPLEVGTANGGGTRTFFGSGINSEPFTGKIYDFALRTGIDGTIVARMNATSQATGTTTWSDGLGTPNTWTLEASAEISDADYRFYGEIPEMPAEWDPTGTDVIVNINASSIRERLTFGQKPLHSPIYRNLSRLDMDGYWPMEDSFGSTSIGAYIGRTGYMKDAAFGTAPELPGTAGALAFTSDDGYASAIAEPRGANTDIAYVLFYFRFENIPAASKEIFSFYYRSGSVYKITINVSATTYVMEIIGNTGTVIGTSNTTFGASASPNQWIAMRILLRQDGANVDWFLSWYPMGGPVYYGTEGTFAGTAGRPVSWISWPFTDKGDLQIAHVALARSDLGFDDLPFVQSTNGYTNESARDRALRLAAELNIPFWWIGPNTLDGIEQTPAMGAQGLLSGIDLLQECADIDGGILFTPRDRLGLAIRSSYSMRNRTGPEIDYTAFHLSDTLRPRENRDWRNDVTVTRAGGSFGRYVKESGSNNVSAREDDPQGIGVFDVSIPRNAATDAQLVPLAEREVLFGTWDELRFALVQIQLHRDAVQGLASEITALDLGSRFDLINLPLYGGGPDDAPQIVRGYTESISNMTRTIDFNATPYGPYLTGIYGGSRRVATATSTLSGPMTASATQVPILTSDAREVWSTTAEPYDIIIAGERMTVTSMGAAGNLTALDGTFESGITGWSGTGGTLSWSSAQAQTGTRSALVTVSGSPTQAYIRPSGANLAPVNAGTQYRASGWIRSSSATATAGASIDWYDSGLNYLSTSFSGGALVANTWTQYSVTGTAPANAVYAGFGLGVAGSPANGTTVYFDNITWRAVDGNGGQLATVTRAINGISKAHVAGAAVRIWMPARWAPDVRG